MARKPRVEFDGAFYHVIVRGNQRQKTFHDEHDRQSYLQRIEHYRRRYGFRLYAYVLMANHVHIQSPIGVKSLLLTLLELCRYVVLNPVRVKGSTPIGACRMYGVRPEY